MKTVSFGVIGTNFVSDWFCEAVGKTEGRVFFMTSPKRRQIGVLASLTEATLSRGGKDAHSCVWIRRKSVSHNT